MRRKDRGGAIVEAALLLPWLVFIFIGTLDFGFYAYAAICTQNAARAAALQTAGPSLQTNALACSAALGELNGLPNMVNVTTCATTPSGITTADPVAVCVVALTSSGSSNSSCSTTPACADCNDADATTPSSAQAVVTYQSIPLIPIPGVLMGKMQLTRVAEARILQ